MRHCSPPSLILAASVAVAACHRPDSILLIEVAGDVRIMPAQLHALIEIGGVIRDLSVPPVPTTITLPASFSVELDRSLTGPVTIAITALDAVGSPLGYGETTQDHIKVGDDTIIVVTLDSSGTPPPDDGGSGTAGADMGVPDAGDPDAGVTDGGGPMTFGLPVIQETKDEAKEDPSAQSPGGFDDWHWQLRNRITSKDEIAARLPLTPEESEGLDAAPGHFRVAVTPYYFSLIDREHPSCPVRMQVIPRARELVNEPGDLVDPLGEDSHSPATGIFHRYPDRCLLLALDRCAIYCRHCNRRRLVGQEESPISRADLGRALDYIRQTPAIRDVLISGGDPLTLSTARLEEIVSALRAIPHVEIVRIGTRVPVVLPMRVDDELCTMLRKYHPLYVNTHFNHPKELTPRARAACEKLADAGIPMGNQTVLLRGVNSSVRVLRKLFTELLRCRVRPYYLFQGDVAAGTSHLRTSVETGIAIMQQLRGHISGLAIPHLVIDTPGGMGKVAIGPDYVVSRGPDRWTLRNYEGKLVDYPQPVDKDATCAYDEAYFS